MAESEQEVTWWHRKDSRALFSDNVGRNKLVLSTGAVKQGEDGSFALSGPRAVIIGDGAQ